MSKLTITGIAFIALGIVSGVIQYLFYGYIDAEGILRDSLFLPAAFVFVGVGSLLLLVQMVSTFVRK